LTRHTANAMKASPSLSDWGVSVQSSTNAANTWLESYNCWQRTAVSTTAHNLLLMKPINF